MIPDGNRFTCISGLNFRHTLYPSYKSNRPPTPDTIIQGLQYLKASIKAMAIKVIEVSLFLYPYVFICLNMIKITTLNK